MEEGGCLISRRRTSIYQGKTSKIDHMVMLRACFDRCRRYGIALNPEKIYLAVECGVLLGHVVSQKGKEPNPEKIEVIVNLQPPSDVECKGS